ncbi:MAG: hypothetical protein WC872_03560 [Candidatus Absconditabacterales bacterium]
MPIVIGNGLILDGAVYYEPIRTLFTIFPNNESNIVGTSILIFL